jgi:hypothetical protein
MQHLEKTSFAYVLSNHAKVVLQVKSYSHIEHDVWMSKLV